MEDVMDKKVWEHEGQWYIQPENWLSVCVNTQECAENLLAHHEECGKGKTEDEMEIKIKGIEELRKKLNDTNWTKIARDAMRDAMKQKPKYPTNEWMAQLGKGATDENIDVSFEGAFDKTMTASFKDKPPKKKGCKSRKYWKRLAKNFQQGLWVYEGWMENWDSEMQALREQLDNEIRGRDSDKCKLDEIRRIYDEWWPKPNPATVGEMKTKAYDSMLVIGGTVNEDPDPAPSYKDARGAIPHKGTERPAEDIINELRSGIDDSDRAAKWRADAIHDVREWD